MHLYRKRSRQSLLASSIRTRRWVLLSLLIAICLFTFLFGQTLPTHAFPVPNLPNDNLIVNPWFRDADDPNIAGLDGWTRVLTNGVGWGLSQKESNPAPDIVVSGVCDLDQVYCGTAARWAEQNGVTYPNIDVYLYQIVAANEAQRRLTFFTHWVSHRVDVAEVTILGSDTPDGPWTQVWVPFSHYQDEVIVPPGGGQEELWEDTGFLEKTIDRGYRYYRIELRSRLPQGDGVGFKITGLYFSTEADGGPVEPHSYVYLPLFRFR